MNIHPAWPAFPVSSVHFELLLLLPGCLAASDERALSPLLAVGAFLLLLPASLPAFSLLSLSLPLSKAFLSVAGWQKYQRWQSVGRSGHFPRASERVAGGRRAGFGGRSRQEKGKERRDELRTSAADAVAESEAASSSSSLANIDRHPEGEEDERPN